jgi:flavin-dependent dehydrogenase
LRFDAVVVGGSVAGATAARELARKGLAVALVEKARFPRPKACGEGLLPHGVAALEAMGLRPAGVPVRGLRYVSPRGIAAEADFPFGHGLVVRRERFDAWLFEEAAATTGVTAFRETSFDAARFPARWVIGADGLRSRFHGRGITATLPRLARVGLSTHVRGLRVDRERVEILIHASGEVYLAPSDGDEALVACLFWEDRLPEGSNETRVRAVLESLDALAGRRDVLTFTTPILGVGPLGLRVEPLFFDNVVLAGDAAGAPDPVTGEGMSLAVISARAMAEALASDDPASYEKSRREAARGSEWLSRWMLRASRRPGVADRLVATLGRSPGLFGKLLEIATGLRRPPTLALLEKVLA